MGQNSFVLRLSAALATLALCAAAGAQNSETASAANSPATKSVLVELFTSLGCSSCPPADALLAALDETQPVSGAHLVVLSEHVTYWDHEGWRDPYSLQEVTDRQSWYDESLGMSRVYTPQVIVDGTVQVLGTDEGKLMQAISGAAEKTKEDLSLDSVTWTDNAVSFTVRHGDLATGKTKQKLLAVLAEDETETQVKAGENAGKTLKNVAVVRVLKEISASAEGVQTLKLPGEDKGTKGPIRLVVFAVDKHTGHVLGVAEKTVTRS
jgi:hypothetical protein